MRAARLRVVDLLFLALILSCTDQATRDPPLGPAFDETEFHTLSGSVLGPDGNICNSLPESSPLLVRVLDPVNSSFPASSDLICPANSYGVGLAPGSYLLRAELPPDPNAIGDFPFRTIATAPVVIDQEDVTRDITVSAGVPLGGRATFDGHPVEGVGLNLAYADAPFFGASAGASGLDGAWVEFFGRAPIVLQNGVRLVAGIGCGNPFGQYFLGARVLEAPPVGGFLFPTERNALDCRLETAPTVAFSHQRTPLVVTPMPGDIGGLSGELFEQFGSGWGVQLLAPGQAPQHGSLTFSQLFLGGLVVGVRSKGLLTGFNFGGYGDCGASCRDFGLDAKLSASATRPSEKKTVTWRYSDGASPDAAGLEVVQRSYDGAGGAAYVLFHYGFTNASSAALTIYPGVFMDWDVGDDDFDAFDDVGFTARGGRLMYMTDGPGGPGTFDGTLVFGAPAAGNAVLTAFGQSSAELLQLATGEVTIPSSAEPTDHRYLHTVGPITLAPHRKAAIWVAVISGHDAAEFFANADAATADVRRRQAGRPDTGDRGGGAVTAVRADRGPARSANPQCKRGCDPH
jgi:hypothetical protein